MLLQETTLHMINRCCPRRTWHLPGNMPSSPEAICKVNHCHLHLAGSEVEAQRCGDLTGSQLTPRDPTNSRILNV